ncbi:MAG: GNAT family N-acetyltransferase [Acidimicrobiales bacterium]|nr:GNAT family N-acetyltransferase [Acidimicrobiales bacterium]
MPATDRVAELLAAVAAGSPPAPDGRVEVVPQPPGPVAGILAFAAHHVVAADVDPAWVHARLPTGDYAAPLGPAFVRDLGDRLGRRPDNLDVVLVGHGRGRRSPLPLVPVEPDDDHPRVQRARRYRTDLRCFETTDGAGLVILGRGLAGRREVAFEVRPAARGRGLGRQLASAGLDLAPAGEAVFVQVAPGNVPSLRAVLRAGGFTPVGGEILFPG